MSVMAKSAPWPSSDRRLRGRIWRRPRIRAHRAGPARASSPDLPVACAPISHPGRDRRGPSHRPRGGSACARKKEPPSLRRRLSQHVGWLFAEFLDDRSVSAPSTDSAGRDQSLVSRNPTRHHDVRHWITSFPLLHLNKLMASPGGVCQNILFGACPAAPGADHSPSATLCPEPVRRRNASSRSASVVARSAIVRPAARIASSRSPARVRLGR